MARTGVALIERAVFEMFERNNSLSILVADMDTRAKEGGTTPVFLHDDFVTVHGVEYYRRTYELETANG